jgi:hypothetical protein
MTDNAIQYRLIERYAARHHLTAGDAARVWIPRHARAFRAWFDRHVA